MIATTEARPRLEVRLDGPAAQGGRLRVDTLVEVAQTIQTAVTRLAYALRGEASVRRGRPSRDIADLTRLEIVGLREGSAVLLFELAEHERPLDELDLGVEALDVFEDGLIALAARQPPPQPWDEGVVQAATLLARVFDKGVDKIEVGQPGAPLERRAVFTRATSELLRVVMPPGTREHVEIEGRLLMADFAATRDQARIHRALEPPVRCMFGTELEDSVLRLLRRYVRATGCAELDDRGQIKALELETLDDAELSPGRSFWDLPTLDELAEEQGVDPVARLEDVADGTWPEDESLDDFLAAIEARG